MLWVVRTPVVLLSGVLAATAAVLAGDPLPVAALVALCLVLAGGYAAADLVDLPVDRVSAPHRPLPSGRVRPGAVAVTSSVATALGLAVALGTGSGPLVLYLSAYAALFVVYARWLRTRWVVKESVTVVAFSSVVFVPVLAGGAFDRDVLVLLTQVVLFTAGREAFMDARDARGDRAVADVTRPGPLVAATGAVAAAGSVVWAAVTWLDGIAEAAVIALAGLCALWLTRSVRGWAWGVAEALKVAALFVFATTIGVRVG